MSEPVLYKHIPDAYSRDEESDLYKLLSAMDVPILALKSSVADFKGDTSLTNGDGVGLDRAGENFSIGRPPGMTDTIYKAVCLAMVGMRRGTVAAIKQVLETATALSWTVEDRQINASIPKGEVWCYVTGSGFSPSYGRGAYADITANYDGDPLESSVAGTILDQEGAEGGYYNDHAWAAVDIWVKALVEKVKMGGTKVVYK